MDNTQNLTPGTRVKILSTNNTGEIISGPNRKQEYCILIGSIKCWVNNTNLSVLAPTKTKNRKKKKLSRTNHYSPRHSFPQLSLDLHGMTVEQAGKAMEELLDRALRSDTAKLELIHGIGSGKVKNAVHKYMNSSPYISKCILNPTNPGSSWAFLKD